jgi:2-haloacid dehalogenase
MGRFRPKYVTFDCHGTLINFQMAEAARDLFGHLLEGPRMDEFIKNFQGYRIDEVMQAWNAPAAATVLPSGQRMPRQYTTGSRVGDRMPTFPRGWRSWPKKSRWSY